MKFKKIIPFFIAILPFLASCTDEANMTLLENVQVSSSYASIPVEGGSTTITVKAKDNWTAQKVFIMKNDSVVKDSISWLTLSTTTGSKGETELTFSAPATVNGRITEVLIKCGDQTQIINVIQGLPKASKATCAEVIAGPDSKSYQVTGICTSIANTTYGNWYLKDPTGTIYIYGTLDAKGAEKNFSSLGIEVGDEVTVQGPKTTYVSGSTTTIELVNVTVVKINKSLIKVDSVQNAVLPVEGGVSSVYLTCKGQGVSVNIPDDAKSWLSTSSIQLEGTNTVVKFNVTANAGGDRNTTIEFTTTDGTKDYKTQTTLSQKGSIIKATVAEFLAAAVGTTQYRLSGVISSIADPSTGKLNIKDFSGEVYVYKIQNFASSGLKVGDIITIVGTRAAYNGTAQVSGSVIESSISVTPTTIADVLTQPDNANTYYKVSGQITSIEDANTGKFYIQDGNDQIYVYFCSPGYGATGNDRNGLITAKGLKVGDTVTLIGTKGSYGSLIELKSSFYFSHVSAQ